MPFKRMHYRVLAFILGLGTVDLTVAQVSATPPVSGRGQVIFAAEHGGGLHIVDLGSGVSREMKVGLSNISGLAYSRNLRSLAFVGSNDHGGPESLYLLSIPTNKKQQIFNARSSKHPLYRPKFDPRGEYLYALNYTSGIFRYSLKDRRWEPSPIVGVAGFNPQGLAFSASGEQVAISPR